MYVNWSILQVGGETTKVVPITIMMAIFTIRSLSVSLLVVYPQNTHDLFFYSDFMHAQHSNWYVWCMQSP